MNKKTVIICIVAAVLGLGVRVGTMVMKSNRTPEPIIGTDKPVVKKQSINPYFEVYDEENNFEFYDEEDIGYVEGYSEDAENFPFEAWKRYVVEDDNQVSDDYQELTDSRNTEYDYGFRDFFLGYKGYEVLSRDGDKMISVPRTEENSYDRNIILTDLGLHYIQLDGNIPNCEQLNQEIADWCLRGKYHFENAVSYDLDEGTELAKSSPHFVEVFHRSDMYVTYNSDKYICLALVIFDYRDYDQHPIMQNLLIDIENGVIIENASLLSLDEGFNEKFKEVVEDSFEDDWYIRYMDDEEMTSYFKGEKAMKPIVCLFDDRIELGLCYGYEQSEIDDYDPQGFLTVDVNDELMEYINIVKE